MLYRNISLVGFPLQLYPSGVLHVFGNVGAIKLIGQWLTTSLALHFILYHFYSHITSLLALNHFCGEIGVGFLLTISIFTKALLKCDVDWKYCWISALLSLNSFLKSNKKQHAHNEVIHASLCTCCSYMIQSMTR